MNPTAPRGQDLDIPPPLREYLSRLNRALWPLPFWRRRHVARLVQAHLLDELDERGLQGEAVRIHLASIEPPEAVAADFRRFELQGLLRRLNETLQLSAFASGGLMVACLLLFGFLGSFQTGMAFRISVITCGLMVLAPLWRHRCNSDALVLSSLAGTALFLPFFFINPSSGGFWRLLWIVAEGTFVGWSFERAARARGFHQLIFDGLGCLALFNLLEIIFGAPRTFILAAAPRSLLPILLLKTAIPLLFYAGFRLVRHWKDGLTRGLAVP